MMCSPLFGVFTGPTLSSVTHSPFIDGIELCLDRFHSIDLDALRLFLYTTPLPVILTLRRSKSLDSEEKRLKLLRQLAALKPTYLDLEHDVPLSFRQELFERYPDVRLLNSYHNFTNTPDLDALYAQIYTPYAYATKIAVTAQNTSDALRMLSFLKKRSSNEKIIGVSMGVYGQLTRILSPLVGNLLTYAPLEESQKTAPGQLLASELQTIYHYRSLNQETQIYALIGESVEKSLGAHFHNAQFASTARNAVYVKIPLTIEEIPAFVSWSKSFAVRGLSVTMPYKESIVSYLQQLDSIVHEIQACNTIHSTSSGWSGYNTDGIGALNAIEAKLPVRGKRIVILGAGGSGKAIAYEAIRRGAHITVFNRSSKTLFPGCRTLPFDSLPQTDYDILISCLPDLNRCVQEHWILPRTLLMDITYTSENPLLKRWAEEKECTLVPGDAMFYQQALEQQRLWQSS